MSVSFGEDGASSSSSSESLEDYHSPGPADSSLVVSNLPDGAFLVTTSKSLHNSGSFHVSSPAASSESVWSSSVGSASLSLSSESLDDSGSFEVESSECPSDDSSASSDSSDDSSSQGASNPLSVFETGNSALGTSLVSESSDNSWFVLPADVSLVLSLSPGGASHAASVESSDNSSTFPGTSP